MSVLKSELKQLVTYEVGVKVEDALESARTELALLEGRQTGFSDGAKVVESLLGYADKDLADGKLDATTLELVKRYLLRGVHALNNAAHNASNLRIAQTGKIQGFEQTVTLLRDLVASEKEKVAAVLAAATQPVAENSHDRPVGVAPASLKEVRLAEAPPKRKYRARNA